MAAGAVTQTAIGLVTRGVKHDLVPIFSSGHAEQGEEGIQEILEIYEEFVADHLQVIKLDSLIVHHEVYLIEDKAEQNAEHVVAQED